MTSKNETVRFTEKRRYTVLNSNSELGMSKRNQEAIRILKRLRNKLG